MPLRRKINTQLIKGEQLHNLRPYLWFGGDGTVRRKQEEQRQKVVRSLNLIANIVLVWNTDNEREPKTRSGKITEDKVCFLDNTSYI